MSRTYLLTTNCHTSTLKKTAATFTDFLAWSGWLVGLTAVCAILSPQFAHQVEDYSVFVVEQISEEIASLTR